MTPDHSEIVDFLQRAGGMGILLAIDDSNGTIHSEFDSRTHMSRATVSKRIREANELGLIESDQVEGDHGNAKRYFLTQIGRVYRVALESMNLDQTYRDYVDAKQTLDGGMDTMTEWIVDNEQFWEGNEFELQDPLKDADTYPGDDVPADFESYVSGEKDR